MEFQSDKTGLAFGKLSVTLEAEVSERKHKKDYTCGCCK